MAEASKVFWITVERRWKLWILPVLSILYFSAVVALAVLNIEIQGVPLAWLVWGGLGLFALTILIEFPLLFRRRVRMTPVEDEVEETYAPTAYDDDMAFAPPTAGTTRVRAAPSDEYFLTHETRDNLAVLEYSTPAKSAHKGAAYVKTHLAVTPSYVLRLETLAADVDEL